MEILNPEGHTNHITGSKIAAILLNGWILPIGKASAVKGLRLQPANAGLFFKRRFKAAKIFIIFF